MMLLAIALLVLGVLFIIGTFLKPKSEKEAENLRVFIEHKKAFRIVGAVLVFISLAIVADTTNKEASNKQELLKLAEERSRLAHRLIEEARRKNPELTEALLDLCIRHTSAVIKGCTGIAMKLSSPLECRKPVGIFSEEFVNIVFPYFRRILPPQASDKDIQGYLLDYTYKLCGYTCVNHFKTIHEELPLYDEECFLKLYRFVD